MFNEICIYEAKLTKLDEIEELMKEVAEFYLQQDGVIDVHYIKRTHRQKDFNAVKEGELPVRLTRNVGKVNDENLYPPYEYYENEHGRVLVYVLEEGITVDGIQGLGIGVKDHYQKVDLKLDSE